MNNYIDTASLENPWWIDSTQQYISTYDYFNKRLEKALEYIKDNGLTLNDYLKVIKQNNHDDLSLLLAIGKLLQDTLIHNPVFQPSEKRHLSLKEIISSTIGLRKIRKHQLVQAPVLLLLLGEARCGQVAHVLVELLSYVGIKSKIEKLNNHIVATVLLNGNEYLIDVDAFKNGIFFFKDKKTLFTKKEILNDPTIIDKFKHTGWMFRKNTRYAKNINGAEFSGYVDFFMPENDGLISAKYGNKDTHTPPGIPTWNMPYNHINLRPNEELICTFDAPYSQRAEHFLLKIGKKSKNYSYNHLIYENLLSETTEIEEEVRLNKNEFVFSRTYTGEYYITVCAISKHLEDNQCYIWWSDELKIIVK